MTAGYSGTPLAKKLGIKEGAAVVTINAPRNYSALVAPLPPGVQVREQDGLPSAGCRGEVDILHIFTNSLDELQRLLAESREIIRQNGAIWISWYKKAAKLPTELTENVVRDAALPLGLVDIKVSAIDDKWSGLKLVIRRENRV